MRTATQPDEAAPLRLDTVYREHVAFTWRTVRYLGVSNAEAEDTVHEVFIIVQRRLHHYDPAYSMRSWIAGITRRVVMHHHRGRRRAESKIAKVEPPVDEGPGPDQVVARLEATALLAEFLDSLDPDKREVFVLGELEDMNVPEVARIMGCNINTVYSRLRTARQLFQARVDRLETVRRREGG